MPQFFGTQIIGIVLLGHIDTLRQSLVAVQFATLHVLLHTLKSFGYDSDNATLSKNAKLNYLLVDGLILNLWKEQVKQISCHANLSTQSGTCPLSLRFLFHLFLSSYLTEQVLSAHGHDVALCGRFSLPEHLP